MKNGDSKQRLSDVVVRKLEYDADGPAHQIKWDDDTNGGERGLGVQVNEKSRSWLYFGRIDGTGAQVRKVIGRTDAWTYAKARKQAAAWRGMCAAGVDPRDPEKKKQKQQQKESLRSLWDDYSDAQDLAQSTLTEYTRLLAHVEDWMPRPYREIIKADCRKRFDEIEQTSSQDQARRVFSLLGSIFRFGMDIAEEDNPATDPTRVLRALKKMGREESDPVPRYSIDQMAALGRELRDWHDKDVRQCGQEVAKWYIWWIVLSGNRLGESSRIRWENVHSDHVILKASDTKTGKRTGKDFEVPLTTQLGRVIEALRPLSNESPWLFTSFENPARHISGKFVLPAARRAGKLVWMEKTDDEDFAPVHRLRHTLRQVGCDPTDATDPNHRGLGLDSNAVSAVLNHKIEGNVSQTTYSYLTGLPKKRDTLQAIDDAVMALTGAVA